MLHWRLPLVAAPTGMFPPCSIATADLLKDLLTTETLDILFTSQFDSVPSLRFDTHDGNIRRTLYPAPTGVAGVPAQLL